MRGWVLGAVIGLALTAPALAQPVPEGLYLMTKFAFGSYDIDAYYFGSDFAVRAPQYDVGAFGVAIAQESMPENVATLSGDASGMRLAWGDGNASEAAVETSSGGCFYWDAGLFCPADPYSVGTLSGTFSGGATASGGGGFVGATQTITFAENGAYQSSTLTSVNMANDAVDAGASKQKGEWGGYEITPNAIVFRPDGGLPYSVSSFPYDNADAPGPMPNRIYFGGLMLSRE